MSVKIVQSEGKMTAYLEGEIDHHTAKDLRESIDEYVEQSNPRILILDFTGVQFIDSSAIGLIMGRFKLMNAIKGKLKVVNIPKNLEKMIKLGGLMALGIFEDSTEEALSLVAGGRGSSVSNRTKNISAIRKGGKEVNAKRNKRNEHKFF